ncbi:LacI family transcriptional regulator [Sinirhodobacter populi]|uniref:LacI family transcriptional regulator n=2 Tax=Paenirhodobacter populi TaxID=2306993 RepID=A0A443J4S1_9RHOB|nr:LacI family transcriptional regulator [Sinirhodobacter populi]
MAESMRPPSVSDVARRAGVSKATAARVLGGYGRVSAAIHAAVSAAAAEIGYRPNELARSMTTGRSDTIGIVVGDIANPFFAVAVHAMSQVLRAEGFGVLLANSAESLAEEKAAIDTLLGRRVDGMIVSPADMRESSHLRAIMDSGVPLVQFDRCAAGLAVAGVTADDRDVAAEVTQMLIRRGHRRIAYFTACETDSGRFSDLEEIGTGSVRERIAGFLTAGEGLEDTALEVVVGAVGAERAQSLATEVLARGAEAPTAMIASDSTIGLGLYTAARAAGIAIPQALSLVTFHDADWTAIAHPGITVISQPARRLGEEAARMLIRQIQTGDGTCAHHVVPCRIISRGSVGDGPVS